MRQPGERRGTDRIERASTLLHREYMLAVKKPPYNEDKLSDISSDGLSFLTSHRYNEGELIEVRLMLHGWEQHKVGFYVNDPRRATDPLVALVRATNVRPQIGGSQFKVGAVFEAIDEWHRDALSKYLDAVKHGGI